MAFRIFSKIRSSHRKSSFVPLMTLPLLQRKQWIRCQQQYYYHGHGPKPSDLSKSLSFTKFSSTFYSKFISGFLVAAILNYVYENFEGNKQKILNKFPVLKAISLKDLNGRRRMFNFIADVAEVTAPAVVYIEIRDTKRFDYYTGQPTPISNGSGFIIDSDGLILTNAHVVVDNTLRSNMSVLVKLLDGRSFEGKVENMDRISDLATVRINCKNLPVMSLGNSSSLKPGEWVVALGSPLALSNTVTCGIISAYRAAAELGLKQQKIVYLQTDAAINQGNSGGPLINLNGEAVGINSMKILPGISFSIPIDHAKTFLKTLKASGGKFQQSLPRSRYMGVTMITLSEPLIIELRRRRCSLSENVRDGVLIWKVIPESPAAK